jgi:hypothetical protein
LEREKEIIREKEMLNEMELRHVRQAVADEGKKRKLLEASRKKLEYKRVETITEIDSAKTKSLSPDERCFA